MKFTGFVPASFLPFLPSPLLASCSVLPSRYGFNSPPPLPSCPQARQRSLPWLLEDDAGGASYVSHLESGGQHSAFYVLIMTGGEFVAVPAGQW